jgi:hypothetical protein
MKAWDVRSAVSALSWWRAALSACDEAAPTTSTLTITSVAFTITGFQIFRVPCEVVRIRAMLHTRIGGQLFPPSAAQTIAETTVPIALRIAAMP